MAKKINLGKPKKIKPLSKRRPLRGWIRRLLGIRPRAWMAQQLDEMHEYPPMLYKTEEEELKEEHPWPKVNTHIEKEEQTDETDRP